MTTENPENIFSGHVINPSYRAPNGRIVYSFGNTLFIDEPSLESGKTKGVTSY